METIYELINIWIFVSFVGAVITSFNSEPLTFEQGSGHFFSWLLLPIITPILLIISLFRKDLKLLRLFFIYVINNKKEDNIYEKDK